MGAPLAPTDNLLLAALPATVYEALLPQLELVEMDLGHTLYESGGQLQYVYFPVTGIVSLLYVTAGGRLPASALKAGFAEGGALQVILLKYTQALITQISQTAVCNLHHSVDQQLCRWLLLSLDRLPRNELRMTQELIANMLGVRREGVTEAAGHLQEAGIIKYSRGRITVLNRGELEKRVCECYAVVKKEMDRLLPDKIAA